MKHMIFLSVSVVLFTASTVCTNKSLSTTITLKTEPFINRIPQVPVSLGELIDKITILEIKKERITKPEQQSNICKELNHLKKVFTPFLITAEINDLKNQLYQTNKYLWDVEDAIRFKEQQKKFDHEFIKLARAVYIINDQRGKIKKLINELSQSPLKEEKQYMEY